MADSILTDTKKVLGLSDDYEAFDPDIVLHVNSVLSTLNQLGVGPEEGYAISDKSNTWSELIADEKRLNNVKSYIYLRVKMLFDPPSVGYVLTAMEKMVEEAEWRIMVAQDEILYPPAPPTPPDGEDVVVIEGPPGPQGEVGPQGVPGPPGPQGPPGGTLLTGWWQYSPTGTPPPATGQLRTLGPGGGAIGTMETGYLHHTDDNGLTWPDGLIQVDDVLYVRDTQQNSWRAKVLTQETTVSGPDGYDTLTSELLSSTGELTKNRQVEINLIRTIA